MSNAADCLRHVQAALDAIAIADETTATKHWREAERFWRDIQSVRVSTACPAATPAEIRDAEAEGWGDVARMNEGMK